MCLARFVLLLTRTVCLFWAQPDRGGAHLLLRPLEGTEQERGGHRDRPDDSRRRPATQEEGAGEELVR